MFNVRAIVIDDEESVLEAVKAILETEHIDVDITASSLKALEMIRQTRYELIISDIKMPELDGMTLLEMVRDISPESIVIMITAYATRQSQAEVLVRGADDYIPKPFTPNEVRAPVRRAFERRKHRKHTGREHG